jgi:large subunit ribosomal protein L22
MPTWHYSLKLRDETRVAKAVARDLHVSPKRVYMVVRAIKGMRLKDAQELLERVIAKKEALPIYRYTGKQAHRRGVPEKWKVPAGKYPVKAAKLVLDLLRNVENNAEQKDLDTEKLRIIHIAVHQGPLLKRYMPRAFGRSSPRFKRLSTVEVVVGEE